MHSIYFDVLSEHGWIGIALFLMIGAYSFSSCMWLVRQSRDRPKLAWANLLGRMGQAVLIGYATSGAFLSQAYLDEYWCIIFIFDAARRLVAKETAAPAGLFVAPPWARPRVPQQATGTSMFETSDQRLG
jgi:putative inorganic carbon (hco3(-)) transporter